MSTAASPPRVPIQIGKAARGRIRAAFGQGRDRMHRVEADRRGDHGSVGDKESGVSVHLPVREDDAVTVRVREAASAERMNRPDPAEGCSTSRAERTFRPTRPPSPTSPCDSVGMNASRRKRVSVSVRRSCTAWSYSSRRRSFSVHSVTLLEACTASVPRPVQRQLGVTPSRAVRTRGRSPPWRTSLSWKTESSVSTWLTPSATTEASAAPVVGRGSK